MPYHIINIIFVDSRVAKAGQDFFCGGISAPKLPDDPTGPSPFPLVACPEVVDLLLNFNADVNTCDESGLTASRPPSSVAAPQVFPQATQP